MNSLIQRDDGWAQSLIQAMGGDRADPFGWMERETRILKSDRHSLVGLFELEGSLCHLKAYRPKGALQSLWFKTGRGRGISAFDHAVALRNAGLLVPEPRTCLYSGGAMLLLTEGIADSADLKSLWLGELAESLLSELMERVGQSMATWHGAGFSHGDCKWSNFLVAPEALYMVDLEGVQHTGREGAGATRDLARFIVNAEDMGLPEQPFDRFIASYCNALDLEQVALAGRVLPRMRSLRQRHLKKYGPRGHQLLS